MAEISEVKIAKEVVELFRQQKQQDGEIKLRSCKFSLPKGCNVDKVVKYIVSNYSYKAHKKENGKEAEIAIGYP